MTNEKPAQPGPGEDSLNAQRLRRMREALVALKVRLHSRGHVFHLLQSLMPSRDLSEVLDRIANCMKTTFIARVSGTEAVARSTHPDFVPDHFSNLVRLLAEPGVGVEVHCPVGNLNPSIRIIPHGSAPLAIGSIQPVPQGVTCLLAVNPDFVDLRQYFRVMLHGPDTLRPAVQRYRHTGESHVAFFNHGIKLDAPLPPQDMLTGIQWSDVKAGERTPRKVTSPGPGTP